MDGLNFTNISDLLDPTKVVNELVIGFISAFLAIVVGIIIGIIIFKYKCKKAEENKQKEKLEQKLKGYIHEHNQRLIDTVIKPLYGGKSASVTNESPIAEHLQTGYTDAWELTQKYNSLKNRLSDEENTIKEYIKCKLEEGIPPNFEQDLSPVNPGVRRGDFTLDKVGNFVYETVEEFSKKQGIPANYKLDLQHLRRSEITVLISDNETDLLEKMESFRILVETIIKDGILYEKFETANKTRNILYEMLDELYQELETMEHDFIERHVELNGTCKGCKDWHDELKSHK
ncbi:MAG: hypothetical protein C5S49_04935 [Candidatus Methanogaster sp.]|nr:MAG: hypothetical protein C5S49_04935 [ANME-2 cluster archaeon]